MNLCFILDFVSFPSINKYPLYRGYFYMNNVFEDATLDKKYRDIAQRMSNKLIDYIASNIDDMSFRYTKQGSIYYRITSLDLGFSSKYYIVFYIHDKDREAYGRQVLAGVDDSNNVHIFYEFDKNINIKENTTLNTTLVHEIIHVLDNRRSGNKIPSSTKGTYDDYVNSPGELNAHYQEMIHEVEKFLDMLDSSENGEKIKSLLMSTPEKFIQFALNRMKRDYIDTLSSENLKKFKKRLYQYYKEFIA